MPASDGGDDFSRVCGPNEWLWHLVRLLDESLNCGLKFDNGAKDAEPLLGQFGKIALHCIEPGAGRRREVKAESLVACQPRQNGGMLVSGVVVENDVDYLSSRNLGVGGIEKAYELLVAVTLHAAANHLALQHVECREERRRAVALVIVGHGSGSAFLQGKARLRAIQCLDLALLVEREDDGMGWRIDIEPHHIAQLLHELRIVGKLELLDLVGLKPMGTPDAMDRAGADAASLRHQRARPVGSPTRWLGRGQRHHARSDLRAKWRYARRPGLVAQQARDAFLHVPLLPAPDAGLRLARPAHDLVGAQTLGRKQHDLGSPDMLLRRVAVLLNRLQPFAVRRLHSDGYARSHPADSHVQREPGIPNGIQMSDRIH